MDLLSVALTARLGSFGLSCFPIYLILADGPSIQRYSFTFNWFTLRDLNEWMKHAYRISSLFSHFLCWNEKLFHSIEMGGGGCMCVHSYEIKWFYKTAPNSDASPHELITIINQANRELKILLFPLIQPSSM